MELSQKELELSCDLLVAENNLNHARNNRQAFEFSISIQTEQKNIYYLEKQAKHWRKKENEAILEVVRLLHAIDEARGKA